MLPLFSLADLNLSSAATYAIMEIWIVVVTQFLIAARILKIRNEVQHICNDLTFKDFLWPSKNIKDS